MLKSFADFEQKLRIEEATQKPEEARRASGERSDVDLRLSYTMNLVLPKTDDPAVFNAIFKSLRDHLLRK